MLALQAVCGSLVMLSGCGPLSNEEVRERYGEEIEAPVTVYANEGAVATHPGTEFENRVGNGSFEEKDETGRPRGWVVSPDEIIVRGESPAVYPFEGDEYVMLRSVEDRFGILAYSLQLGPEDLGKTVIATAQGRAPLWRYMFLSVRYAIDGKYTEHMHEWSACPHDWTENIARETIPLDADPESVEVRVIIRDEPGYTYCVDHVRAFVLDGDSV